MNVSENIKRIRKERGLTQKQLGELCDPIINEANIRKYENGKQTPKLITIEKIAAALGVSAFDLMGFEYFDLKNPNIANEIAALKGFESYLNSLGYSIEEQPAEGTKEEGATACSYDISGNGVCVALSDTEYQQLQTSSSDLIFSFLLRKQQDQQKK